MMKAAMTFLMPSAVLLASLKTTPGAGCGERLCNQAISWVSVTMIRTSPQAEVDARIAVPRRELAEHVATHSGVELPAAGAE
jgi:hypothetical protein